MHREDGLLNGTSSRASYKVFPSPGLVMGFQYKGQLARIQNQMATSLSTAGITGISDSYKVFRNSANIGTVLVYFTEVGFAHFASLPAHELFNQSVGLDHLFDRDEVAETEDRLANAQTDWQRVRIVEQFFLSQLKVFRTDQLIAEAVKLICQSHGTLRIRELTERFCISQSAFEKRFRKLVGTSPKKFASIIRFNAVLDHLGSPGSPTEICYANRFFDQAHFIRDFRQYTGDTPGHFKRIGEINDFLQ